MEKVKNLIIGFGKAGKTLANIFAKKGESTILIERSNLMYGGTCINVACIPSKTLENLARESAHVGGSINEKEARYTEAINKKKELTAFLRQKNYEAAIASGVKVVNVVASFKDNKTIEVYKDGALIAEFNAERIVIDTGSRPFILNVEGIKESKFVYASRL